MIFRVLDATAQFGQVFVLNLLALNIEAKVLTYVGEVGAVCTIEELCEVVQGDAVSGGAAADNDLTLSNPANVDADDERSLS